MIILHGNLAKIEGCMQTGKLRIISGKYRGRKIQVPNAEEVRPTTDRVRETVFNWLQNDLHNAVCLDAFAGSGVLGFEALSRGAASVCFVEKQKRVFEVLRVNAKLLGADNVTLINNSFEKVPLKNCPVFDVVFFDPPFYRQLIRSSFQTLLKSNRLAENALIYVECEASLLDEMELEQTKLLKQKIAGEVGYSLYRLVR